MLIWFWLKYFINRRANKMSETLYKPGEDNKPAGKYTEVGPRGGQIKNPRHATNDQGDRLPPTQQSGNKWKRN